MAAGNDSDADPFETPEKAYGVEKALGVVLPLPPKRDSLCADLQESLSPLSSAEGTTRPSQKRANVLGLGWSASHLEKVFTCGTSVSFHDPPRQYTLARRTDSNPDNGAPNAVFVLRNSPQIIEEDSLDEELEPEDRNNGGTTPYFFPCEDLKINELVSKMANLSLGTVLPSARTTLNPCVRVRAPTFVPARTTVSSPVAVFHPVLGAPVTAEHATPMKVDEDVLYPKVVNKGAPRSRIFSEAIPMDSVVFYPEAKDVEMSEAFATNRKLLLGPLFIAPR